MAAGAAPPRGRRGPLTPLLDTNLWIMLAVLAALAFLAHQRGGTPLLREGLGNGVALLARFGLLIVVSFVAAGLAEKLVPTEWVRSSLGAESGTRGIVLGSLAGAVTPAGPFVSMPVAAVMLRSGAAPAAVVSYLTSWSLLALARFVAWEVPILGLRFALLRYGVCLVLPLLAGLLTRLLWRA